MIYHETERTSDYVFQIEEWRGEEEGQVTFKRTIRLSDNFASACYLPIQPRIWRKGKKKQLILFRTPTEAESQVNEP